MTDLDLVAALLGRNQTLFLRSVFLLLDSATLAACLAVTPAWRAFIRAQLLGSPRIFPRVLARAWRDVKGGQTFSTVRLFHYHYTTIRLSEKDLSPCGPPPRRLGAAPGAWLRDQRGGGRGHGDGGLH